MALEKWLYKREKRIRYQMKRNADPIIAEIFSWTARDRTDDLHSNTTEVRYKLPLLSRFYHYTLGLVLYIRSRKYNRYNLLTLHYQELRLILGSADETGA